MVKKREGSCSGAAFDIFGVCSRQTFNDKDEPSVLNATASARDSPRNSWQGRILVHLECPLFAINMVETPLAAEVALNLDFASEMYRLAACVLKGIAEKLGNVASTAVFNGYAELPCPCPSYEGLCLCLAWTCKERDACCVSRLHLRIEPDAKVWIEYMGGEEALFQKYLQTCRDANMTTETPLYVASTIFRHLNASRQSRERVAALESSVASVVLYKEMFVPAAELNQLDSEQQGLLDFLVLVQSQKYVGFEGSTFAFFVQEWRYLHGKDRSSTHMLKFPKRFEGWMKRDKYFRKGGSFQI
jgi:GDP-fucose protein O-fucosyltransferase